MPAQELSAFDAASILIVLAAALGYLNQRFFKLPPSVGLTVMGAVASLLVVAVDKLTDSDCWLRFCRIVSAHRVAPAADLVLRFRCFNQPDRPGCGDGSAQTRCRAAHAAGDGGWRKSVQ